MQAAIAVAALCFLSASCSPASLISVAAAGVGAGLEISRASGPPNMIHRRTRGQHNDKLVYDDDPRIPGWCADPSARRKIARHCEERDERARVLAEATGN